MCVCVCGGGGLFTNQIRGNCNTNNYICNNNRTSILIVVTAVLTLYHPSSNIPFSQSFKGERINEVNENWWYNHISSEYEREGQVLHTV